MRFPGKELWGRRRGYWPPAEHGNGWGRLRVHNVRPLRIPEKVLRRVGAGRAAKRAAPDSDEAKTYPFYCKP